MKKGKDNEQELEVVLSSIYNRFGKEIFQEKNKFIGVFFDMASKMEKEKRLLEYMFSDGIMASLLEADNNNDEEKRLTLRKAEKKMSSLFLQELSIQMLTSLAKCFNWNISLAEFQENCKESSQKPDSSSDMLLQPNTNIVTKSQEELTADELLKKGNKCYEKKDYQKMISYYLMAANKGNFIAQCNLGCMYESGKGVPVDFKKAFDWYKKAAGRGYDRAECYLGEAYEYGEGVEKDLSKAFDWYKKAADKGYARAQLNLGLLYDLGKGIPVDDDEAIKWYRKAAEQQYAKAELCLGSMYELGRGCEKNLNIAKKWYSKSFAHGNKEAKKLL